MKSNCEKLGEFIEQFDIRAKDSSETYSLDDIVGISSVTKTFIPTKANLIDVTVDSYKIVPPGYFAYNPNTARMGDKVCVGLNQEDHSLLVSSIYPVFRINSERLKPEYLLFLFMRPEFDRWARFVSHGSAREVLDWDRLCEYEIPIPSIIDQQRIAHDYHAIANRIDLLCKINEHLETVSRITYEKTFGIYYSDKEAIPDGWKWSTLGEVCSVKGGKRLPAGSEFASSVTEHPYIRIRDMYQGRFVELTSDFEYIDNDTFTEINRYTVETNDVIIAIVGVTAGEVSIVGKTLHKANLTENCVKLCKFKDVTSDYVYSFWQHMRKKGVIESVIVGAVQPKLPIYNIESLRILVPDTKTINTFQKKAKSISLLIQNNIRELQQLRKLQLLIMCSIGGSTK